MALPQPLTYEGSGKDVLAALKQLKQDPERAEKIAAAGHELVRRALRPDNIRRQAPSTGAFHFSLTAAALKASTVLSLVPGAVCALCLHDAPLTSAILTTLRAFAHQRKPHGMVH